MLFNLNVVYISILLCNLQMHAYICLDEIMMCQIHFKSNTQYLREDDRNKMRSSIIKLLLLFFRLAHNQTDESHIKNGNTTANNKQQHQEYKFFFFFVFLVIFKSHYDFFAHVKIVNKCAAVRFRSSVAFFVAVVFIYLCIPLNK